MLCFSGDGSGNVSEEMMYSQQSCVSFSFVFLFIIYLFFFRFRFKGNHEKRFDYGSQNCEVRTRFARVPVFFHVAVLKAKRTTKMSSSRFFRSDCTVRSGFQNHGYMLFSLHVSSPSHACGVHPHVRGSINATEITCIFSQQSRLCGLTKLSHI